MGLAAPARHSAFATQHLGLGSSRRQQGYAQRCSQPWNKRAVMMASAAPADYTDLPTVYTGFYIYKDEGAVSVKPLKPKWSVLDSGAFKLEKEGGLLFEVAPRIGTRFGTRVYGWAEIRVALSPVELSVVVTDPDKEEGHTFSHDRYKYQPGREGTLVTSFVWCKEPNADYRVTVSAVDRQSGTEQRTSATCSITAAEFGILKQLVLANINAFYGFDVAMSSGS